MIKTRGVDSIVNLSFSAAYMGGFFGGPTLHARGIFSGQAYMKGVCISAGSKFKPFQMYID